jgi:hypothetical protein
MELPVIILIVMGIFAGVSISGFWTIILYVLFARGRTRAEADAAFEAANVASLATSIQTEVLPFTARLTNNSNTLSDTLQQVTNKRPFSLLFY